MTIKKSLIDSWDNNQDNDLIPYACLVSIEHHSGLISWPLRFFGVIKIYGNEHLTLRMNKSDNPVDFTQASLGFSQNKNNIPICINLYNDAGKKINTIDLPKDVKDWSRVIYIQLQVTHNFFTSVKLLHQMG